MTDTTIEDGVRCSHQSIREDRLAIIVGAGLSIPSGLFSGAGVAWEAKQSYDLAREPGEPELSEDIEEQANFFYANGQLATYYIPQLVPKHAFAGKPNEGHTAVADLLLTRAVRVAVSTNYDRLIEAAGSNLDGAVEYALNGVEAADIDGAPLLKIHGCWDRDRDNTVWTPKQLEDKAGVVAQRVTSSANWLASQLANVDLLVIGFWSDWSYLNAVITESLGLLNPTSVTIVDPDPPGKLQMKAPGLYTIGASTGSFRHVQAKGEVFLDRLRERFSKAFVRHVLRAGVPTYNAQNGTPPDEAWTEPAFGDNHTLWQVRRDLQGCLPHQPATQHTPPAGETLGLTMIELQAAGAVPEGPYWRLPSDQLVRVLNGSNRALDVMKSEYDRDMTPVTSPSVVVAVGADDNPLPGSIARSNPATSAKASSVRGAQPDWLTRHSPAYADLLA